MAGNALKAGVRFLSYDSIKLAVADKSTGQLTLSRSIAAGFLAGLCEGAFAVTPSEAIKTRLIEDGKRPKAEQHYRGLIHGAGAIMRAEGLGDGGCGRRCTGHRQLASISALIRRYACLSDSGNGTPSSSS